MSTIERVSKSIEAHSSVQKAAMVLGLMVFATWNDLVHLRVVDFFVGLVT